MPISQTLQCHTKFAFSTNFYRAGASSLPISTAPAPRFYQFLPVSTAARSPFYPKKPIQNDREETQFYQFLPGGFRNSTNFYRAVFEILPISTGRFSKFYHFLPVSTGRFLCQCWYTYRTTLRVIRRLGDGVVGDGTKSHKNRNTVGTSELNRTKIGTKLEQQCDKIGTTSKQLR